MKKWKTVDIKSPIDMLNIAQAKAMGKDGSAAEDKTDDN